MAEYQPINHFGDELCKILGLEQKDHVTRIIIDARVNALTTITIEHDVMNDDAEKIEKLIKKYEITELKKEVE